MAHSRKIVGAAAGVTVAALALAACSGSGGGGGGASANGNVTLTILSPWSGTSPFVKPLKQMAAAFEKANPKVTVQITPVAVAQVAPTFESTTLAGDPADIVITNPIQDALAWVGQGATVQVSNYMKEWGLESALLPGAKTDPSWHPSSGFIGFPFQAFIWPTWYNKSALSAAGVTAAPTTEAQLMTLNSKLKAAGKSTFTVGGLDWSGENTFFQIIQTYVSNPDMLKASEDGDWGAYPGVLKGIQYFVSLRDAGLFSKASAGQTIDQMTGAFFGNQVAGATLVSDYFAAAPSSLLPNLLLSGIPVPPGAVQTKPAVMAGYNSYGFMISKKASESPSTMSAVEAFMKFAYQPAEVGTFVSEAAMPPALKATENASDTNPLLLQVTNPKWLASVDIVTPTSIPANVASNLTRALAQAWVPGTSAQTILQSMEAAYKQ